MANPLFENPRQSKTSGSGGIFELLYNKMYRSNPAFRDFANSMKGKSIEQAFAEKGFDYSQYKHMSENDMADFMHKNGIL